jgi:hypothetical protein
MYIHMAARA